MLSPKRALVGAALLLGLAACDGCRRAPVEDPLRFVSKDAEGVLELRSLDLGVRLRAALPLAAGDLLPAAQIDALARELELALGFDPTTAAGLAAAGLPESGPVVAQLAGGGRSALWIFPVKDDAKLRPLLDKLVRVRVTVDEVGTAKLGDVTVTRYLSSFGDDKNLVAAVAFAHGLAFVGAGRDGEALIGSALALKKEDSVHSVPEYVAQVKALGEGWDARFVAPSGGKALGAALRTAAQQLGQPPPVPPEGLETVASTGYALRFTLKGVELTGRVRLDAAGLERSRRFFGAARESAVGRVDVPGAVIRASGGLEPEVAFELIAPPGSPVRSMVDGLVARVNLDLGADLGKDLLPLLTGEAALAIGLADLRGVDLSAALQDPRGLVWTAFAFGMKDPAAAARIEKQLVPGLAARGFALVPRDVKGVEVRSMVSSSKAREMLVETFALPGAWAFSNSAAVTEAILASSAKPGPVQPGFALEVRFDVLAERLGSLDVDTLPIVARGFVVRFNEMVRAFDAASLRVSPAADGVVIEARVGLAGRGK